VTRRIPRQWIVRVLGSTLVLGITLWLLPTEEVWGAIKSIPLGLWLSVLGVFLLGHAVSAAKWWLIAARGSGVTFAAALKAHFAGLVANLCLPGVAGGDVVRAGLVFRKSDDKARVAVGSLADRLIDCFGLFLLACLGAAFSLGHFGFSADPLLKIGLVFVIALAALGVGLLILPRLPMRGVAEKLATAVQQCRRQPGRLALCLALSMAVQAVFVGLNVALAQAGGVEAGASVWFFAWPLAKLAAIVPISISGLGVREASLAALMAPFGAAPAKVVAIGLLWQTILFAGGLIGGLALLLTTRLGRPGTEATPEPLARRNP